MTLLSPPHLIPLGQGGGRGGRRQGGGSTDPFSPQKGQGWPLGLCQGRAGSPCGPAGMLENELSMTCSHELHADVETAPSIFRNSKYQCFLSTFIILNWSHKERVAVAVVFKVGRRCFCAETSPWPVAPQNKCGDQITVPWK